MTEQKELCPKMYSSISLNTLKQYVATPVGICIYYWNIIVL